MAPGANEKKPRRALRGAFSLWLILLTALPAAARPVISLIIDDVGDRPVEGARSVALPGPVACAFLPHTPHAARLARQAHRLGKEVMLHQPMQATRGNRLGPGGVTMDMERSEFLRVLRGNLAALPHVSGVNNHMGSLLTRHPGYMAWLMEELRYRGGLFFVDSRTSQQSVALRLAREMELPSLERDVFLDHYRDRARIRAAFEQLVARARRYGSAVGIGHPYPATLDVLEEVLPELEARYGVRLISVREMIERRRGAGVRVVGGR
ncbi:divergent polysaccharide deacetylase family protein [Alkalilimnicola sp. S0819]|uniref:divergent polysaccharide deacetylase family protein n=1 Tax=Alkalilimnicola sp. S0819 TaxID=2613922 RepID=UPI001261E6CB|nr:divergent polysaccharide deacetylase family protein [Alkalilimnicola sp. S0819]KAB7622720.1 divergent polysaccharide deacetylase family protein [Alkalilimnicola sp. S0819]MPQ17360.1 divergent polysaccharide deacetylase family protein [Alkalilimnicola sp. S0819]